MDLKSTVYNCLQTWAAILFFFCLKHLKHVYNIWILAYERMHKTWRHHSIFYDSCNHIHLYYTILEVAFCLCVYICRYFVFPGCDDSSHVQTSILWKLCFLNWFACTPAVFILTQSQHFWSTSPAINNTRLLVVRRPSRIFSWSRCNITSRSHNTKTSLRNGRDIKVNKLEHF